MRPKAILFFVIFATTFSVNAMEEQIKKESKTGNEKTVCIDAEKYLKKVSSLCISDDGSCAVVAGVSKMLLVLYGNNQKRKMHVADTGNLSCIDISGDGKKVVIGTKHPNVYTVDQGKLTFLYECANEYSEEYFSKPTQAIALNFDGSLLVTRNANLFTTYCVSRRFQRVQNHYCSDESTFSGDKKEMPLSTRARLGAEDTLKITTGSVAISSFGKKVLSLGPAGDLYIDEETSWGGLSGYFIMEKCDAANMSGDGQTVVLREKKSQHVRCFKLPKERRKGDHEWPKGFVLKGIIGSTLQLNEDGTRLLEKSDDNEFRLHDTSGKQPFLLKTAAARLAVMSRNGNYLLLVKKNNIVRVKLEF